MAYNGVMTDKKPNKLFLIISGIILGLALIAGCFFLGKSFFKSSIVKNNTTSSVADQAAQPDSNSTAQPTLLVSPGATPSPKTSTMASPSITPTPSPTTSAKASSTPSYSAAFQWGVTVRPNVFGKYSSKTLTWQTDKMKDLGVGWARVNWDYDNSDAVTRNKSIISNLSQAGFKTLLVIEHNPNKGNSNLYQQGLDDAKLITDAVGGSVDYYQLANEGGAQSLISGRSGVSPSDFDNTRYTQVRDYIKGLSDGITKADPGAKKIVTISWTHSGFLDRLISDGVYFDMIGIDWYSWMGAFSAKKINDTQTLYSKLQSLGKPLTFMEVAQMPTASGSDSKQKTTVDETAQANFLTSTANWAWANRTWVKGFYHFELVDNTFSSGYTDYYGLIKVNKSSDGATTLGDVRKAFSAYKSVISGK